MDSSRPPLQLSASRTYPVALEDAFDRVLPMPLERVFPRRYLAIAPTAGSRDFTPPWGHVGQTRTVEMTDGGTLHEELTTVERPHSFGYHLVPVTGPLRLLVGSVDGGFTFEPAGTGTRITWWWALQARSSAAARALPLLARLWRGYARLALESLEGELVGSASPS